MTRDMGYGTVVASCSSAVSEPAQAQASGHDARVARLPPYYMDEKGHVYAQEWAGGSIKYLGLLGLFAAVIYWRLGLGVLQSRLKGLKCKFFVYSRASFHEVLYCAMWV